MHNGPSISSSSACHQRASARHARTRQPPMTAPDIRSRAVGVCYRCEPFHERIHLPAAAAHRSRRPCGMMLACLRCHAGTRPPVRLRPMSGPRPPETKMAGSSKARYIACRGRRASARGVVGVRGWTCGGPLESRPRWSPADGSSSVELQHFQIDRRRRRGRASCLESRRLAAGARPWLYPMQPSPRSPPTARIFFAG
jgi:hypothetical protein